MGSLSCAEYSLNNAHCIHVAQTCIMFCVSIETRLWKAGLKKRVDKGFCYMLYYRNPRYEWLSLAFMLHVLWLHVSYCRWAWYFSYHREQNALLYSKYIYISFLCYWFIIYLSFSLICSFIHFLVNSFIQSFILALYSCSLISTFVCSFVNLSIHPSFVHYFIHVFNN